MNKNLLNKYVVVQTIAKTMNRLGLIASPFKTLKMRFKFLWNSNPMLVIGAIMGDLVILSVLVKVLFF